MVKLIEQGRCYHPPEVPRSGTKEGFFGGIFLRIDLVVGADVQKFNRFINDSIYHADIAGDGE